MTKDRASKPVDRTLLFRVGAPDFNLMRGRSALHIHHEVRADGVFIVPVEYAAKFTQEEQQRFLHPTGNPGEPILPFRCSMNDMLEFFERESYSGTPHPSTLTKWMLGRVDALRRRGGWEWLDAVADELFTVQGEDIAKLLPSLDAGDALPPVPCTLGELVVWCDVDDIAELPRSRPTSASIVDLILTRLQRTNRASNVLHHNRRHSIHQVILALDEVCAKKGRKPNGPRSEAEITSVSEEFLLDIVIDLLTAAKIENKRGAVKRIASEADTMGLPVPSAKTLSDILTRARKRERRS